VIGRAIHLDRHASAIGSWEMATGAAEPRLRAFVRDYTGYVEHTPRPLRRREAPSSDVTLIVSFGDSIRLLDPADPDRSPAEHHVSFVAGLHDGPAMTEHAGVQHGVEIRLTPFGAGMLLGMPARELANRVVRLDDALGPAGSELAERLALAPGWSERFDLLDAALAGRAAEASEPAPELMWAWWRLRASHGRERIHSLVEEIGWSHRRFIVRFREQVGLGPKTMARVLRFDHVARRLRAGEARRFAELAYECGYADQAHLNRDFRQFAGTTPSEYVARLLPDGGGVEGGASNPSKTGGPASS
jgi:AraC-like DNA-binding protein